MKLHVDTREDSRHHSIDKICKSLGIPFDHMTMECGDIATDNVIMERKTIQDFCGSVIVPPHRIFDQLNRLDKWADKHGYVAVLGISGTIDELDEKIPFKVNKEVLYGAMASTMCRYRMHLLCVLNDYELIKIFWKFAQKVEDGKYGMVRRPSLRKNTGTNKIAHVMAVLRISQRQATELLNVMGSLRKILTATDQDLLKINGIGQATISRIRAVID